MMLPEPIWECAEHPLFTDKPKRKRARRFTAQDRRAFIKRVQKRRQRKGYR